MWENLKKRVISFLFVSINFTTWLKLKKWFLLDWNLNFQKCTKKGFSILFLFQKRDDILFAEQNQKIGKWVSYSFSSKKYFEMLNKNGEKNDSVWNKRKVSKKHNAKKCEKRKEFW